MTSSKEQLLCLLGHVTFNLSCIDLLLSAKVAHAFGTDYSFVNVAGPLLDPSAKLEALDRLAVARLDSTDPKGTRNRNAIATIRLLLEGVPSSLRAAASDAISPELAAGQLARLASGVSGIDGRPSAELDALLSDLSGLVRRTSDALAELDRIDL